MSSSAAEKAADGGLAASISAIIFRYVSAYDREEDIGEPDFDECWSLEQICNVIAKRVISTIQATDACAVDLACALYEVLDDGSQDALMAGDPLQSYYSDGELLSGVLLDGRFDLKKAATSFVAKVATLLIEVPPGTHTLSKTIHIGDLENALRERDAHRAELAALRDWSSETLGNITALAEHCIRIERRAQEHLDGIETATDALDE